MAEMLTAFGEIFSTVQNQLRIPILKEIIVCVAILLVVFWKRKKNRQLLPPGPYSFLPIVGYLPLLGRKPHEGLHKLRKKYGNVFGLYLGRSYVVILGDYLAVKDAFSKSTTTDRPTSTFDFVPDGVGFSSVNGEEWVEQRNYCVKAMKSLGIGRNKWEDQIQNEVEEFVRLVALYDGQAFDCSKLVAASVSNNISSFVFGTRMPMNSKNIDFLNRSVNAMSQFAAQVGLRSTFPLLCHVLSALGVTQYAFYKKDIVKFHNFVRNQVEVHQKNSNENSEDFINGYLLKIKQNQENNLGNTFNYTNLHGNLQAIFIGSSDTTKTSLTWLFLAMASHMDIQAKVHQELDSVLGREGKILWSERASLPYTYATIMEGQRWKTVAPINTARIATEDIKICGYDIPKGTIIMANNWGLHNDIKYWNDPEKFQPERFLLEDGTKVNLKPESYVPFSYGEYFSLNRFDIEKQ
ncbi:cytochrome P450 2A6 [Caerostris extrusa]|uniref:Cytochrome P450 2A6 n=1 Tax=Caerostris extrusa TaxID=172846 RepID=A0AAV4P146_CAEEX|nr:cytochrome P450 2A6 [Caerostris extrusa]